MTAGHARKCCGRKRGKAAKHRRTQRNPPQRTGWFMGRGKGRPARTGKQGQANKLGQHQRAPTSRPTSTSLQHQWGRISRWAGCAEPAPSDESALSTAGAIHSAWHPHPPTSCPGAAWQGLHHKHHAHDHRCGWADSWLDGRVDGWVGDCNVREITPLAVRPGARACFQGRGLERGFFV